MPTAPHPISLRPPCAGLAQPNRRDCTPRTKPAVVATVLADLHLRVAGSCGNLHDLVHLLRDIRFLKNLQQLIVRGH